MASAAPIPLRWLNACARALCGASAVVAILASEPARGETLIDAMRQAHALNPSVLAERSRQTATEELIPRARSSGLPSVSIEAGASRRTEAFHPGTDAALSPASIGARLSQPLFDGFRTDAGLARARAEVASGALLLIDREQRVLLEAAAAYLAVLRDREQLALEQANLGFLRQERASIAGRQRAGDLSLTDVAQAEARLYEGEARLAAAKAQVSASETDYAAIIGRQPGRLARPVSPEALIPRDLYDAVSLARAEHPAIKSASFKAHAARHDVEAARGSFLPTVTLDASVEREIHGSTTHIRKDDASVGVRFNLPLDTDGSRGAELRERRATANQRSYEAIDTRVRIEADVVAAWKRREAARARITASDARIAAAEAALRGMKVEADVGERSTTDVLDAQREVIDAKSGRLTADFDRQLATYTLLAAMGQLDLDTLARGAPDRVFDHRVFDHGTSAERADEIITFGPIEITGSLPPEDGGSNQPSKIRLPAMQDAAREAIPMPTPNWLRPGHHGFRVGPAKDSPWSTLVFGNGPPY